MGKRICIVGFSGINRSWAGKQPKNVEIWGLNEVHNCTKKLSVINELGHSRLIQCKCRNPHICTCESHEHGFIKKYDRWFQLHERNWKDEARLQDYADHGLTIHPKDRNTFGRNQDHWRFLKECDKPLFMKRKWPGVPGAQRYPFEKVEKALGIKKPGHSKRWMYATSTPAYMIALALYEHMEGDTLDEIRLAGIELAVGTEYFWQRPCMEYYLGVATGMGIEVKMPPQGSSMLAAPRYAVDEPIPTPKDFKHDSIRILAPTQDQLDEHGIETIDIGEVVAG